MFVHLAQGWKKCSLSFGCSFLSATVLMGGMAPYWLIIFLETAILLPGSC